MTHEQTVQFFIVITSLWPRDTAFANATDETVKTWHRMLEDIPADIAVAALKIHASFSPFPPSIAEIRKYAVEIKCPALPTDEAYKLAIEARRKYGWCNASEGMESLPEAVRATIKTYCGTFLAWCSTEESQGVERAHFMKIYEAQKDRTQRAAALPPGVAETMKLVGNIGLLEG